MAHRYRRIPWSVDLLRASSNRWRRPDHGTCDLWPRSDQCTPASLCRYSSARCWSLRAACRSSAASSEASRSLIS